MATIAELLDRLVVTTTSPDGNLRSTITNSVEVSVKFRPGSYAKYSEETLSHQIGRLGALTFTGLHKGRDAAYKQSQGLSDAEVAEANKPHWDAHRRRYEEALNEIQATGVSAQRKVRLRTKGILQWKVDIREGTLRELDEERFLGELQSAIRALLNDRQLQVITLKSEYFDLGVPASWQRQLAALHDANQRGVSL